MTARKAAAVHAELTKIECRSDYIFSNVETSPLLLSIFVILSSSAVYDHHSTVDRAIFNDMTLQNAPCECHWEYIGNQRIRIPPRSCGELSINLVAECHFIRSAKTHETDGQHNRAHRFTNADGTTRFLISRSWVRIPPIPGVPTACCRCDRGRSSVWESTIVSSTFVVIRFLHR